MRVVDNAAEYDGYERELSAEFDRFIVAHHARLLEHPHAEDLLWMAFRAGVKFGYTDAQRIVKEAVR